MCSIMGVTERRISEEELRTGFDRTLSRGPDMSRIEPAGNGWLCFHRLAIMDPEETGMQPFHLDGDLCVCNGELYGFRTLKKKLEVLGYTFGSDSDCEILLPLFREHGCGMFRLLDAEFALVIYDSRTGRFIAARDPIGIRPLYYGTGKSGETFFASEAKNLTGLCDEIFPFPPGHYWENGVFTRYADVSEVRCLVTGSEEELCEGIRGRLIRAVEKRLDADVPVGFLLSGGLDSSLVCAISARLLGKPVRTFAIGMDSDPIDLRYARIAADYIGAEHTELHMSIRDVLDALEEVVALLGTWDVTTIRAGIGMYLCCRAIHERTDIRVLLTGEISDELFGYKYTDFAPSPDAFQQEAAKRIRELHMYDVLRADRCISVNSLEARVPFGDLDFVRYVMAIDPVRKMNTHGIGKYLLRKAFEADRLLPGEILWRQKAAFSDAVGHSMVNDLKAYAETVYSDSEYEKRRLLYPDHRPFSKESLLYRELFEKHYPGQAHMISDYWMPNRAWPGCDVDDPSARVLANYGASGT